MPERLPSVLRTSAGLPDRGTVDSAKDLQCSRRENVPYSCVYQTSMTMLHGGVGRWP